MTSYLSLPENERCMRTGGGCHGIRENRLSNETNLNGLSPARAMQQFSCHSRPGVCRDRAVKRCHCIGLLSDGPLAPAVECGRGRQPACVATSGIIDAAIKLRIPLKMATCAASIPKDCHRPNGAQEMMAKFVSQLDMPSALDLAAYRATARPQPRSLVFENGWWLVSH